MKVYYDGRTAYIESGDDLFRKSIDSWDGLINRTNLFASLKLEIGNWERISEFELPSHPPISGQELWAAGVTYLRSKTARMEEAEQAGGGSFYDRVYDAARPEIFMKATASRTVGHGETVYIRKDSNWNVPEPELTLFISSAGTIEGYTIGNDMSSRSIEGENPLYLPQAKVYDRCAGLGPGIFVTDQPLPEDTEITLEIFRNEESAFKNSIQIDQIKRRFEDLVDYLYRECSFPHGCFLMTGTGIVPPDEFTLEEGDRIEIQIEQLGKLTNFVGLNPNANY